ncbi:MAG: hypothetical protein IJV44_00055 [Prevotella sp.]|nr:hypothetical protein [Prevotella sp.]
MALTTCSYCGHSISKNALECPICHHSFELKGALIGIWGKVFLFSCILILVNLICNGSLFVLIHITKKYDSAIKLMSIAPIVIPIYYIGLIGISYVIGKTFKAETKQKIIVGLLCVAFVIREFLFLEKDIDTSFFRIIGLIILATAFLIMSWQVQKELRVCLGLLLIASLCHIASFAINYYDFPILMEIIGFVIETFAFMNLFYISYKQYYGTN